MKNRLNIRQLLLFAFFSLGLLLKSQADPLQDLAVTTELMAASAREDSNGNSQPDLERMEALLPKITEKNVRQIWLNNLMLGYYTKVGDKGKPSPNLTRVEELLPQVADKDARQIWLNNLMLGYYTKEDENGKPAPDLKNLRRLHGLIQDEDSKKIWSNNIKLAELTQVSSGQSGILDFLKGLFESVFGGGSHVEPQKPTETDVALSAATAFGEIANSVEAGARAETSRGAAKTIAEAQSAASALRAVGAGLRTIGIAQQIAEKDGAAQKSGTDIQKSPAASPQAVMKHENPRRSEPPYGDTAKNAETMRGLAGVYSELAKSSEADARAANSFGSAKKAAEAESDAAALRAVSKGFDTAANALPSTSSRPHEVVNPLSLQRISEAASANRSDLLKAFETADRELNVTYKKAMSRLNREGQDRLKAAQRDWIRMKESSAGGDTLEDLKKRIDMTIERTTDLSGILSN